MTFEEFKCKALFPKEYNGTGVYKDDRTIEIITVSRIG